MPATTKGGGPMFGLFRRYFLLIALALSAVVPFFATGEGWQALARHLPGWFDGTPGPQGRDDVPGPVAGAAPVTGAAAAAQLEGPEITDLRQIFRFDVTPESITRNWTRVTTVLGETELEGMRVPVVTGTRIDDLAGSLTYYFDRHHHVQRITFHGDTGDPRRLVALASESYGLQHVPTLGAGLYLQRWNGAPTSALRISRAPVVHAASPHSQLNVAMELNRPGDRYGLSAEMRRLLTLDQKRQRW